MLLDPQGANCNEIRPTLQAIDADFDIFFDVLEESYHIMHKGNRFQTVHHTGITLELMDHIRHMTYLNKNEIVLEHIEAEDLKRETQEEKKLTDMAENMARDLRRPLIEHYLY